MPPMRVRRHSLTGRMLRPISSAPVAERMRLIAVYGSRRGIRQRCHAAAVVACDEHLRWDALVVKSMLEKMVKVRSQ
jgi:hypothetical protein